MKRILHLLLCPALILLLTACSGSDPVDTTGSIAGTVYDADQSDLPLKGVQVTITGHETSITKTTDAQGKYAFTGIEIGQYTVQASLQDYATQTATAYVSVGQQRQQDFHLRRASSQLVVRNQQLDFGLTTTQMGLDIENAGQALMQWEVIEDIDWLECTRSGQVRAGDKATITVTVNRSGKSYGDYNGSFVISTTDGGSQSIRVTMSVGGGDSRLPEVQLYGVSGETDVTASFSGELIDCGDSPVSHYGFAWSTQPSPKARKDGRMSDFNDFGRTDQGQRQMSYMPTNLEPNTTYYVRAYAVNVDHPGDTVYSRNEVHFSTKASFSVPTSETGAYTDLTATAVTLHANITNLGDDIGITQHGHIWSATQKDPRQDNTSASEQSRLGSRTQLGTFSTSVDGLKPGTTYYYRAYATNAKGTGLGEVREFTTPVGDVKLTTNSVTSIIHNEATGGGHITDLAGNTITERGVCWGTESNPNLGGSYKAAEGNSGADWTVRMTGLTEKTTYHVRAYVRTAAGGTYFGNDVLFTTSHEIRLPQTSATQVSAVGVSTATLRATLTNDGDGTVSDMGFCIATHPNPSVADTKVSSGTSAQTFSKVISGLQEGTTYYVCAYAINERGTGYGDQATFTTLTVTPPTLSGVTISGKSFRSATFAATVTSRGNGTLKRTGFCYATSPNPTLSNHLINCGTDTSLRGSTQALTASTTYYVRAFAENEKGVAYSEQVSFTTDEQPEGTNIGISDYGDDTKW